MPVPALEYKRSTSLDWSETVTCRHCGKSAKGRVATKGKGTGKAYFGIGREAAQDSAAEDAFENAVDRARRRLELSRCPHCGRRHGGLISLGIKVTVVWALVATLSWAVVMESMGEREPWTTRAIAVTVLIAGCALALAVLSFRYTLGFVDRRVRIEPIGEWADYVAPPQAASQPSTPVRSAPPAHRPAQQHEVPEPSRDRPNGQQSQKPPEALPDSGLELDVDRKWNRWK